MKVIRYLIIIVFFFFLLNTGNSQQALNTVNNNYGCGTVLNELQVEYMNNTRELRQQVNLSLMRNQQINIPVAVHVIVENDGQLAPEDLTPMQVDEAIENLNNTFASVGLNFVSCLGVNYIAEDGYPWPDYDRNIYPSFPQADLTVPGPNNSPVLNPNIENETEFIVALENRIPSMLNIFFAPGLDNNPNLFGWAGFAGFKGIFDFDWIFVRSDVANTNVLAHEIGHYFNLYHTTQGEGDITGNVFVNEVVARPPDGSNICPNNDPNNPGFMDTDIKCNCGPNVGDELCDTPAAGQHPQFLECVIDCEYVLGDDPASAPCTTYGVSNPITNDSNGDHYEPDVGNIMAYTYIECLSHFSPQQINRMLVSLVVDRPELLSTNCLPCSFSESFNNTDIHNANTFEVYPVSGDIFSQATVKSGNLFTVYNARESVCLNTSFEAEYGSTFIAYIDGCEGPTLKTKGRYFSKSPLSNFKINPNPVSSQAVIEYELKSDSKVSFSLFDTTGKQVANLSQSEQKVAGLHQLSFNVSNLPTGIYYCTMQANDHIETQKIVITK